MPVRKKKSAPRAQVRSEIVNPFFIGGGFVRYCVQKGWLELEGFGRSARYRVTPRGRPALKRFGIEV